MSAAPYPIASRGFWRCYWITLRPYLFFVSAASGLVGLALSGSTDWAAFVVALAAFFFSYGLGQAVTDVFQRDTDSISSPYRPLTQGRITGGQVLGVSLLGLGLCAVTFALLSPWTLLLSAVAVAGLIAYTPLKRRWWGGPPWNAAVVALLPAIGLLALAPNAGALLASHTLLPAMGSVFLSYAVFVLLGYFKDIEADQATGYHTLPVRFGRRVAIGVSAALGLGAVLASGYLVSLAPHFAAIGVALWLAGVIVLLGSHVAMLGVRRDADAHGSIGWCVRGFVALHLGEAVAFVPTLAWPALIFYAFFEGALALRPEESQI